MKLSKPELAKHEQAVALLSKQRLTDDEALFVLRHWHPSAVSVTRGQSFFTPTGIAQSLAAVHGGGGRIVDACAGIGALAWHMSAYGGDITCIESNPEFVEVGKKVLPGATWICGNVFEILPMLPLFDSAISNPPFGAMAKNSVPKHFQFKETHWAVIELLLRHTRQGATLVLPKGCDNEADLENPRPIGGYSKFRETYPLADLSPTAVDTEYYDSTEPEAWCFRGTGIRTRVVNLHFPNHIENPYMIQTRMAAIAA